MRYINPIKFKTTMLLLVLSWSTAVFGKTLYTKVESPLKLEPKPNSGTVYFIPETGEVNILKNGEINNGYYYVDYSGLEGWILANCLTEEVPSRLTPSSDTYPKTLSIPPEIQKSLDERKSLKESEEEHKRIMKEMENIAAQVEEKQEREKQYSLIAKLLLPVILGVIALGIFYFKSRKSQ